MDLLLFYLAAKADPLIADAVVEYIQPRFASGFAEVTTADMWQQLREWIAEGRMHVAWNEETTERVAHGILSTLRDFGLLSGTKRKRITPPFLPNETFALLAFLIRPASGANGGGTTATMLSRRTAGSPPAGRWIRWI